MTKILLLAALTTFICISAKSQYLYNFRITKDIDSLKESFPNNEITGKDISSFAVVNGITYFDANDAIHGDEIWRSDGTTTGTYMVKDINPGNKNSNIKKITGCGNKIYFSASNSLWVSDGTKDGTIMLPSSANPDMLTDVSGTLFYLIGPSGTPSEIWKSDGTITGTMKVVSLHDINVYYASSFANMNGKLYFCGIPFAGNTQLFKSDGTAKGTVKVKDVDYSIYRRPLSHLTPCAGKLYFYAYSSDGYKLWVSDGTTNGTTLAPLNNSVYFKDPNMDDFAPNEPFAVNNNTLYFVAKVTLTGYELYKYTPGDNKGATLVKDIYPGRRGSNIYDNNIVITNNILYFKVTDTSGTSQLWKSGGTDSNTIPVKYFMPNENITDLCAGNNTVYFAKTDPAFGKELWKTDGTNPGTQLIKDVFPGATSSNVNSITYDGNKILFSATGKAPGNELWKSDGTASGTDLVRNINNTQSSSSTAGYIISSFSALNGKAIFSASENARGNELYVSDGSYDGTFNLKDIFKGEKSSNPRNFLVRANYLYCIADNDSGNCIYKTDGSKENIQLMVTSKDQIISMDVDSANGLLYYIITKPNYVTELWRSDGTPNGTFIIISPIYGQTVKVAGKYAYFTNNDNVNGVEVWKTDGTVNGTQILKDITPGISGSFPNIVYAWKNKVFFLVYNNSVYDLWSSNGKEDGTIRLTDNVNLYIFGSTSQCFYFSRKTNETGYELWRTNGSVEKTYQVKDINKGTGGSYVSHLTSLNNTIYFGADDGIHGNELWKSDGTDSGTVLVKDVTPGKSGSYFNNISASTDKVFFCSNSSVWGSDGTSTGTMILNDTISGKSIIDYFVVAAGNHLFVSGSLDTYGYELFTGDLSASGKVIENYQKSNYLLAKTFDSKLLINPIVDNVICNIYSAFEQRLKFEIYNVNGKLVNAYSKKVTNGTTNLFLSMNNKLNGMYILKISGENGTAQSFNFIKGR